MAELTTAPIGLIPAAGSAERLGSIPCSKEILPVGTRREADGSVSFLSPCGSLLEAFDLAGIATVMVVTRRDKTDIEPYLREAAPSSMSLLFRTVDRTPSVLHTVAPFLGELAGRRVAFGFPDILFRPRDAFAALAHRLDTTGGEVVLGCFPNDRPGTADMVEITGAAVVEGIDIKNPQSSLELAWSIAVWTADFTDYLREYIRSRLPEAVEEPFVGHAFKAALADKIAVLGVAFPDGETIDIGTVEGWQRAVRRSITDEGT